MERLFQFILLSKLEKNPIFFFVETQKNSSIYFYSAWMRRGRGEGGGDYFFLYGNGERGWGKRRRAARKQLTITADS